MKFLILALIVPWFFFFFFYSRLVAFKKSNLALKKELEAREAALRRPEMRREEVKKLREELQRCKEALADAEMELQRYRKERNALDQGLYSETTCER